jgi:hypothetical protein
VITTTAPATAWVRIRHALTTACLIPVFLGALLLGPFEQRLTPRRALVFWAVCWATAAAIVLVVTR